MGGNGAPEAVGKVEEDGGNCDYPAMEGLEAFCGWRRTFIPSFFGCV